MVWTRNEISGIPNSCANFEIAQVVTQFTKFGWKLRKKLLSFVTWTRTCASFACEATCEISRFAQEWETPDVLFLAQALPDPTGLPLLVVVVVAVAGAVVQSVVVVETLVVVVVLVVVVFVVVLDNLELVGLVFIGLLILIFFFSLIFFPFLSIIGFCVTFKVVSFCLSFQGLKALNH